MSVSMLLDMNVHSGELLLDNRGRLTTTCAFADPSHLASIKPLLTEQPDIDSGCAVLCRGAASAIHSLLAHNRIPGPSEAHGTFDERRCVRASAPRILLTCAATGTSRARARTRRTTTSLVPGRTPLCAGTGPVSFPWEIQEWHAFGALWMQHVPPCAEV